MSGLFNKKKESKFSQSTTNATKPPQHAISLSANPGIVSWVAANPMIVGGVVLAVAVGGVAVYMISSAGTQTNTNNNSSTTNSTSNTATTTTSNNATSTTSTAANTATNSTTNTSTSTSTTVPGQVTGLQAASITSTTYTLNWLAVSGATSYKVFENNSSTVSYTPTGTNTYVNINSKTPATTYNYTVVATNSAGDGTPSSQISVLTLCDQVAGLKSTGTTAPTSSTATVSLSWTAPTGTTAPASYTVKYGPHNGSLTTWSPSPTTTSVTITGLNSSASYDFTVQAHNATGDGVASTTLTVTTISVGLQAYLPLVTNYSDTMNAYNGTLTGTGDSFISDSGRSHNVWSRPADGGTAGSPYITLGAASGTGLTADYSYTVWVKPTAATMPTVTSMIIGNVASTSGQPGGYYLYTDTTGKLTAGHFFTAVTVGGITYTFVQAADSVALTPGQWYFVAVTYQSSTKTITLYKNSGTPITAIGASSFVPTANDAMALTHYTTFAGLQCSMSDVSVYNTAISSSDVAALYSSQL